MDSGVETFETPEAVRERIRRPTVAAAMKRVFEDYGERNDEWIGI